MRDLYLGLRRLWRCGDTRVATVASILSGVLWAACLAFPGDTLERPTYRFMGQIAPEWVWMATFAILAAAQTYRLKHRFAGRSSRLDYVTKFAAMLVWGLVAVLCMVAQYPPAAAVSDSIVVALATVWDFLRHETRAETLRSGVRHG
jgi:hypothetical protein